MPFGKKKEKEEKPKVVVNAPISKEEAFKRLQTITEQIDKQHGENSLIRLGGKNRKSIPVIPTKLPTLDYETIGVGGIPRGRIIEIFGPESSGKTTMCLEIVAAEQALGGICAYVDAEHALDTSYAAALGVDIDELLLNQPGCGEEALDITERLVDSKCVSLIVVDSVAALVPRAELEGAMGDAAVGLQARLMSQACRKLVGKCEESGVTIIFINQIREKIGVMFGSPEVTTGGRALKFYSSIRMDVRRKEPIKINPGERLVGHKLHIKIVKNKVATPFKEVDLDLYYPDSEFPAGLDKLGSLIEYCDMRGLFEKSGSWFSMDLGRKEDGKAVGVERLANGMANLKDRLRDDEAALKVIRKKAEAFFKLEKDSNGASTAVQQSNPPSSKS